MHHRAVGQGQEAAREHRVTLACCHTAMAISRDGVRASAPPSMTARAAVTRHARNRPEPSVDDTARPRSSWPLPVETAASCVNRSGAPPANESTVTPAIDAGRRRRSLRNCAQATRGVCGELEHIHRRITACPLCLNLAHSIQGARASASEVSSEARRRTSTAGTRNVSATSDRQKKSSSSQAALTSSSGNRAVGDAQSKMSRYGT